MPEFPPEPITEIAHLKAKMQVLFAAVALPFHELHGHGVMFCIPGKVKPCKARLAGRAADVVWSGEAGHWTAICERENWLLTLNSSPSGVLCIATILTRHRDYLAQYG